MLNSSGSDFISQKRFEGMGGQCTRAFRVLEKKTQAF
jgi:hypothetical protein